jgi:hypothetical protein
MEQWIVIEFFPHSPITVHGVFVSENQAIAFAEANKLADDGGSYSVNLINEVQSIGDSK